MLLALPARAAERQFAIDKAQSELVVKIFKAGLGSWLAHNHVVRASDVTGELCWDPENADAIRISATVPVRSLVADEPLVRRKYGETSALSESDRRKITASMFGETQLDAKRFPTIRFNSTGVQKDARGRQVVVGDLTLHGVTRRVGVPVTITVKDGVPTGDGKLRLRTSDYGIAPYSAALGAIRNQDEVMLILHLVASPQPGSPRAARDGGELDR